MAETWIRFWAKDTRPDAATVVRVEIENTGDGGWRAALPPHLYSDRDPAEMYEVELLTSEDGAVVARSTATINMVLGRRTLVLRGQKPFAPAP